MVSYIRNFYLYLTVNLLEMRYSSKEWMEMKKYFGITNKDVSEIIGASKSTVDEATSPKYRWGLPKWAKMGIWVFNEMKNR